ncbi:MAG: MarR family winged helix-turn-helix transcriptional regulator [bacterium]
MKMEKNKDKSVGTAIGRTLRVFKNTMQKHFEDAGFKLSVEQWLILLLLKMQDGRTQQELCNAAVKEKTTVTRLIDALEKKQMLLRVKDKNDRRNNLIYITDTGRQAEEILTPIAFTINEKAVKGFKKDEIAHLLDMLNRMVENLSDS